MFPLFSLRRLEENFKYTQGEADISKKSWFPRDWETASLPARTNTMDGKGGTALLSDPFL